MSRAPDRGRIRVLCLVPYPTAGASNRVRVEQYAPALRSAGIDLSLSPFLDDATYRILYEPGHDRAKAVGVAKGIARRLADVVRAKRYDLALIHRETAPLGPPLVERALGVLHVPYVFDFDDAIYLPAVHPANRRWAWLRGANAVETTRRARAVIASNEYLADWARGQNADVTIIPSVVETEWHRPRPRPTNDVPVIGWLGSSSTAPYLHLLDDVFTELARTDRFVVRVVGASFSHSVVAVESVPFRLAHEPEDVGRFDIGVLPQPDDPWTRGKAAFKGIVYMANGVPVVASLGGVNAEVIPPSTGYCVDGVAGWVEALRELLRDPARRAAMGHAGHRWAEERYSVKAHAPRLAALLRRVARPEAGQSLAKNSSNIART